jgi:hypothetical protein
MTKMYLTKKKKKKKWFFFFLNVFVFFFCFCFCFFFSRKREFKAYSERERGYIGAVGDERAVTTPPSIYKGNNSDGNDVVSGLPPANYGGGSQNSLDR